MNNFTSRFEDFIDQRTEDIWADTNQKNVDYKEIGLKVEQAKEVLLTELSKDKKELFIEYQEMNALHESVLRQETYKKGLHDGISLLQINTN